MRVKLQPSVPWTCLFIKLLLHTQLLNCVWLYVTPWAVSHQVPSVHGILQARILEWVVISFSRGSSWPRDWTPVFCTVGRFFMVWVIRDAPKSSGTYIKHIDFQTSIQTYGIKLCQWIPDMPVNKAGEVTFLSAWAVLGLRWDGKPWDLSVILWCILCAAVNGVAKSQTRLSDWTTFICINS